MNIKFSILIICTFSLIQSIFSQQEDSFLWLEEIDGDKAMEFVTSQNKITFDLLTSQPEYQGIYDASLAIYNSEDRIVYPSVYGDYVYNFWQDAEHVRGIWRRATKGNYLNGVANWEILLDLDSMSAADNAMWVFKSAEGLFPNYERFLVNLSKGGGDATETREYSIATKSFIKEGFFMPESKGSASYLDENTLIVSSDFGENSMTTSGYPNEVKIWKRGTPLSKAELIFTGKKEDVGTWGYVMRDNGKQYGIISNAPDFFTSNIYFLVNNKPVKLDIPIDCQFNGLLNNQIIISLKSDWKIDNTAYKQGALISLDLEQLLQGKKDAELIYMPDAFSSVNSVTSTKSRLVVNITSNVISELYSYNKTSEGWKAIKVPASDLGSISVIASDELSDIYYFTFNNFLTPTTLFVADANTNTLDDFQTLPAYFDASNYKVEQLHAKSMDGTMIPYFIVSPKNIKLDGSNPTLLTAYGGFEVSKLPYYSATIGKAWLENGGVYVLANIRGGGEFGPQWHLDGMKEKRQNVYDDFFAVSNDLITRGITSPQHLGIQGGSNGGLLMGVALTQHPELYNSIVCAVPLLDMKRYNKLLAGASWMGEYGNPDIPEEWDYIKKYSPYHNLKQGTKYPEVLFLTSTRDDRVHPGHARKMAAKMEEMGSKIYYYENIEGGHGGASTNAQQAKMSALTYTYLLMKLK
ncbi:MAG: prolyl oligopeptidase family serine peptidase [Chitinophagales bacterium]